MNTNERKFKSSRRVGMFFLPTRMPEDISGGHKNMPTLRAYACNFSMPPM